MSDLLVVVAGDANSRPAATRLSGLAAGHEGFTPVRVNGDSNAVVIDISGIPTMKVEENVALPAQVRRRARAEIQVDRALEGRVWSPYRSIRS